MKFFIPLLSVIGCCLVLASCELPNQGPEEEVLPFDLIAGEDCQTCEVIDLSREVIVPIANGTSVYELDVNFDGVSDFRFYAKLSYPDLGHTVSSVTLKPLHNTAYISSSIEVDTFYSYTDTVISTDPNSKFDTIITFHKKKVGDTAGFPSDAHVEYINSRRPELYPAGQDLDVLTTLRKDSVTFRYFETYQGGGSVGRKLSTNDIFLSGGISPLPKEGYLAFTVVSGSEKVTGYIDLKLTGNFSILLSRFVTKY